MKYAKIVNGNVVDVVSGLQPEGYIEVQARWGRPDEYPASFYAPTSNIPRLSVVGSDVFEDWGFVLKSVDSIKDDIYQAQKENRQKAQLGSFTVGDATIELKDREDSLIIASLTAKNRKFKIGKGQWMNLTGGEVQALKDAHELHVQAAYDGEQAGNEYVASLSTHNELLEYLNNNEVQNA